MTKIFEVIRRPLLTEKSQILRENNVQVFEVATWANKNQIKEAVELLLQTKVVAIKTVTCRGRAKRMGRFVGKPKDSKKAYVHVAEGQLAPEL